MWPAGARRVLALPGAVRSPIQAGPGPATARSHRKAFCAPCSTPAAPVEAAARSAGAALDAEAAAPAAGAATEAAPRRRLPFQAAAASPEGTFYRRPLPPIFASFSSARGQALFAESMAAGGLRSYFKLAETYATQSEPAYCGLSTLSMTLNALAIDPRRRWKGVWRWFDEEMLECCVPLSHFDRGMSFSDFAKLARCNGAVVAETRAEASSLDAFRAKVRQHTIGGGGGGRCAGAAAAGAATGGDDALASVLVVNYNRAVLGQTGEGHFSPVAAYAPESDQVLILDVARFKYPPHWTPTHLLWEAMADVNPFQNQSRGFFEIHRPRPRPDHDRTITPAEDAHACDQASRNHNRERLHAGCGGRPN
ncbi:hypothetical protein M885DRAFT_480088 [Pelagophyceae sp. CCMP2097]|nr:hypothetical protein M885DRAFT_480088 [Pelagophyceae sp. CCMP2097]